MACDLSFPTVLLLYRLLSAQYNTAFCYMTLVALVLCNLRLSLNHLVYFMLPKRACIFLKINFLLFILRSLCV
jgi:hypothetical protein